MPAPTHPALKKRANHQWRDIHHANQPVRTTRYEVVPRAGTASARLADVGGAVRAALQFAFTEQQPLRVAGGRWSLSEIGRPSQILLDLCNYRTIGAAWASWLTPNYRAEAAARGVSPMLMAGSVGINAINGFLADKGLALQTSGASDGQTLAGAMATGTHGADLKVGALHDTVKAIHLVVSPTQSLLLQPKSAPLTDAAAQTLESWFGIPCQLTSNDALFRAALVHLGSLGIVLNYIVETVPLYFLSRRTSPHQDGDLRWRTVLTSRHPRALDFGHPLDPDFLQLVLNPYLPSPMNDPRAWVMSMTKTPYSGQADVVTEHRAQSFNADLADIMPAIVSIFEDDFELPNNPVLRFITSSQLRTIYKSVPTNVEALPGVMFGPPNFLGIDFDPACGASGEYVFNATQARAGVSSILATLDQEAVRKNQYFGALGVRFVRGSEALLAMNNKKLNCFVELQGIFTNELSALHAAVGKGLRTAGIPYAGHWGQYAMNTPAVVASWWGTKAADWTLARKALLPTAVARKVFASPILAHAGLG
jgi:hypothetical protein